MAATKSIQLLGRPNQANWTGTKKAALINVGDKVSATGDTVYQFVVDEQEGLPKGTKIVKRDTALEFELPDGRAFQLANWCGIANSKLIDLTTTTVYDEASGKYVDGVDAISSGSCAWIGANGTAGSVGSAGAGGIWLAAAGLGLAAIALSSNSNGTSAAPPVVTQPPGKPGAILSPSSDSGTVGDNTTNDTTPTISGTGAVAGNTITVVTPKGEVLKTTVAADGTWSVEPKVAFALGAAAVQITATDPSGNVSPATTLNLTIVGTGAFTVAVPEGPVINLAESTSGGGVPVTVALPANAAVGDVITVSIDGSTPVSYTVKAADVALTSATILIPTADINAAGQGSAIVTTTYKDAAGNVLPNITTNLTIDTIVPASFTAAVPEGAVINSLESTSDGGVPVSVALPANAVAGDVITVSIDGSTPVSYTVTAANVTAGTASVLIPTTDVALAGQGPAIVTTTYADAAGNAATPVTTNLTIDTVVPSAISVAVPEGPVINLAESTDGLGVPITITLPANAVAGDVITVSIDGSTPISYTVLASNVTTLSASVLIPTADIVAAGQGGAVVTTTYTDAAGNAASTTTNLTIDTVAPTLDLDGNNSSNATVVSNSLGLKNTGLNGAGTTLLGNGDADSNYVLTAQPLAGRVSAATTTNPGGWAANDADSQWIGGGNNNWEGGEYRWATSFNVAAGTNLSTILVKFDVASDNYLTDILVNGVSTGLALNSLPNANNYSLPSTGQSVEISGRGNLFTAGTNTITFVTYNGEVLGVPSLTPTGLRVDNMSATYLSTGGSTSANLSGFATTYVENASTARSVVDSDVAVVEANNIQSATITLTNHQANDLLSLSAALPTGVAATSYDSATGVLTLSGAASATNYQSALSSVVFSNANADPAVNPVRAITFTLTDAAGNTSASQTSTVDVVALKSSAASITPVTIDLNGDGQIDYSQLLMDVTGDGIADRTAWVGAHDGVLVWDKNQNGQITDASQYAFSRYGGATDLSGLAAGFDSNKDGAFNAADSRFSEFAVWQDANQNGISDTGEVLTLISLGITSIALDAHVVSQVRADGVEVLGISNATLNNGQTLLVEDAKFSFSSPSSSVLSDLDLLLASNHP
jgi:Bacterial Ig-like domain